ncbi:MAG TPA: VWA domain-containing protein [Thermoanaerobaculia bacterium]|nr:VWA domain-containing protein [Thermoanaerobaculia bacterium]
MTDASRGGRICDPFLSHRPPGRGLPPLRPQGHPGGAGGRREAAGEVPRLARGGRRPLVFTFYNFNGVKGRRAILLLSDGKDEGSRFTYEEALELARRAGVTVDSIGLGEEVEKRKLARLSEETGGRAFFPRDADELAGIYAAIQEELRAQYLIAYQSSTPRTDPGFRVVDLKVSRSGLEAKTIRGYYP